MLNLNLEEENVDVAIALQLNKDLAAWFAMSCVACWQRKARARLL
jgi:hypothetical protein